MSVISNVIRSLKKAVYSDCEWLRCYEVEALTAFYLHITEEDKGKLIQQFKRLDMMERSKSGKLLQIFDGLDTVRKKWPKEIKIYPDEPISGYKFALEKAGKEYAKFVLFLGRGGIGEIQFEKMPSKYQSKVAKVVDIQVLLSKAKELSCETTYVFKGVVTDEEEQRLEEDLHGG
ncbi:hypothetical protein V4F62_004522 [Vibrio parahaemolyticus]|uniref:Uncharacterized protein n=1 Tax=Vibrio parahaemolyticus TaxID=670 RepID=A0A162CDS6_VIBPH|nr:hypothetical protein [Vibrio parahaemolyticus]AKD43692.1 hypothetical protein [Vibrio parahaemolyticus]TOC52082.1 hypothetical protein CGJ88_09675 [Vibrio parahaemolyticus]